MNALYVPGHFHQTVSMSHFLLSVEELYGCSKRILRFPLMMWFEESTANMSELRVFTKVLSSVMKLVILCV